MLITANTVMTAIAALSVSGVNIKDLSAVPMEVQARDCPIIYPRPDALLRSLTIKNTSLGKPSTSKKEATYTLNYAYLHSPVSVGRGLYDKLPSLLSQWISFVDALTKADALQSSILYVQLVDVPTFDEVQDPAGSTWFHGGFFSLNVTELGEP